MILDSTITKLSLSLPSSISDSSQSCSLQLVTMWRTTLFPGPQELCGVEMKCNETHTQEGPLKLTEMRHALKCKENWRKLLLGIQTGDKLDKPLFFVAYSQLCCHCRNLTICLLSPFHFTLCCYFLDPVACRNLPWQGLSCHATLQSESSQRRHGSVF